MALKPTEVFLKGVQAGSYKRIDWLRATLCLVNEDLNEWEKDPYPYRVVQRRDGFYYVDPEQNHTLVKIQGADPSKELIKVSDTITLPKGCLPNVKNDINTYVGNVIINAICLIYPFGNIIPFMEGVVTIGAIEKEIIKRLKDDPENPEAKVIGEIYVSDYLRFTEAMTYLREICDIVVPTTTAKTMTPPPGIVEYRQKLLDENKDRLNDPAVLAQIDKKLVEYDTEYLKDDDDAQGILLAKKLRNEVRRKRFLTMGGQTGFGDGVTVTNVAKSLSEGTDIENIPILNSSSRAGSFNRGHQTMNGGAQFKKLIRAASNSTVSMDDCGATVGKMVLITEENLPNYIGVRVITPNGYTELTQENAKQYIGKEIQYRSPMYCKAEKSDYCKVCAGEKLSLHPTAIAVSVSDVGSAFLILFLKKMHVSGLSTAKMDFRQAIK